MGNTRRPRDPYRLDQTTHNQLIDAATRGATNRDAATIVGIAETTLWRWLTMENPSPNLAKLQQDYAQAKANARQRSVELIANSDDWRAHAWLLERVDPKHWGKAEIDPTLLEDKLAAYLQGHADATTEETCTTSTPT